MSDKYSDDRKIFLIVFSAAILIASFVLGSQFVQHSLAQDLGQMGQQPKEKIGSAAGQILGGNQTGNQSAGMLGQLGEQARSMLPGQ